MSTDRSRVPVIVIGFKRADLIYQCLDRLSRCRSLGNRRVRIFLDGPRTDSEVPGVRRVSEVVELFRPHITGMEVIRRTYNFGCCMNITEAVSETLGQHGEAIVVEEDVRVSPSFLEYMDSALDHFRDDSRIWCVNGYVSPWMRIPSSYREDVFLCRRNAAWGWGTWTDRWSEVDFDLNDWGFQRQDPDFVSQMEFVGRDVRAIAELQAQGKINTWDIQCTIHMIKNGQYAVNPRYSQTKNIGFATDCEHCVAHDEVREKQKFYDYTPRMPLGRLEECPALSRQFRDDGLIEPNWRFFFRRLRRKYCRWGWTPSHNEPIVRKAPR